MYKHISQDLSPATQESYRYTLAKLQQFFQNRDITDITSFDIDIFLRQLISNGCSRSLVSKCKGMLSQIFSAAIAHRLILLDPVQYTRKLRYREPPRRRERFTPEEVDVIFEQLPKDDLMSNTIRFMIFSGLRPGEMMSLRRNCISESGDSVDVERGISLSKNSTVGLPKTISSFRTVPLPEKVREAALFLRNSTHQNDYIWESRKIKGKPCNPSWFRKLFRRTLE